MQRDAPSVDLVAQAFEFVHSFQDYAGLFGLCQNVLSEHAVGMSDPKEPRLNIWMRRLQGLAMTSEAVLGCFVCV